MSECVILFDFMFYYRLPIYKCSEIHGAVCCIELPLVLALQAYEVCTKRGLTRERVFILGRMGNSRDALALIINELKDIEQVSKVNYFAAMRVYCD